MTDATFDYIMPPGYSPFEGIPLTEDDIFIINHARDREEVEFYLKQLAITHYLNTLDFNDISITLGFRLVEK